MTLSKRTFLNSASSVLQAVIAGLMYFFLYKFLLKTVGAERLGLWSIVVASTSIANLGSFGLSGSIVKFIANYLAMKDHKKVNEVVWTGAITVVGFMVVVCTILFFLADIFFPKLIPLQYIAEAKAILPFALLSLLINSIGGIFLAAFDGMELMYYRASIYITTSVLFLISCYLLVPGFGLMGMVYAQVAQAIVVLFVTLFLLSKKLASFSIFNIRFSKVTFIELFNYGLNFQVIALTGLLFDPITKFCLSSFGQLSMVAYFEMASRLIAQIRSLIVSASQVMVPIIAKKSALNQFDLGKEYRQLYAIIVLITVIVFSLLIAFAPLISAVWIGSNEPLFFYSIIVLTIGWSFNIFATPAYFINMGLGTLRSNVVSHILAGVINLILGVILGKLFGGRGVIVAVSISIILSSLYLEISFKYKHKILAGLLTAKDWSTVVINIACSFACILFFYFNAESANFYLLYCGICLLLLVVLFLSIKINPRLENLFQVLKNRILPAKAI